MTSLSCSINQHEEKLIGQWNDYPIGGMSDIKFYKDSLVSFEYGKKRTGEWKANSTKIRIQLIKTKAFKQKEFVFYYKVSTNGDSLILKMNDDLKDKSNKILLRVNNHWEHYLKELELKIELPIPNFKIHKMDSTKIGIDIYVGYDNDSLIAKSISGVKLRSVERIESLVYSMKSELRTNQIEEFYFSLIADKHVPKRKIDSIKQMLSKFSEIETFRVYHTELENYGKYNVKLEGRIWDWYGKYE